MVELPDTLHLKCKASRRPGWSPGGGTIKLKIHNEGQIHNSFAKIATNHRRSWKIQHPLASASSLSQD